MSKILTYIFDPLCGWCYGASAPLADITTATGITVELLPSGLFSGSGARTMDDTFADYAWSNDQRIARLTGQPFSAAYRNQVLTDRHQSFDSGPATVALTAVALTTPARELETLKLIQRARYVDGQDITKLEFLAELLHSAGLVKAAARLLTPDKALLDANQARIHQARELMQKFHIQGVPTFILNEKGQQRVLHASAIFSNPQAFINELNQAA